MTRAVDAAALFDAAMAVAAGLAASSVTALASTRELLFSSYGATLEEQLGAEARMIARSAGSEEAQALIQKFAGQGRSS